MKLFYHKHLFIKNTKGLVNVSLIILILITTIESCVKSKKPGLPEPVIKVINNSGINRTEYLKAIVEFQNPEDSLKQKALYYLISNISSHYYAHCNIIDSSGKVYNIDFQKYSDSSYTLIYNYLKLAYKKSGRLKVENDKFLMDINNINHNLLINSVSDGFKTWKSGYYKGNKYSFNTFCEYILPYRVSNEPMEDYREFFNNLYGNEIKNYTTTGKDIISLSGYIHYLVKNTIKYGKQYEFDCNLPKLEELIKRGEGNYRQLSVFEVEALRTFGIASALDYSPLFANSSGGYYWPVIFLPKGNNIPLLHDNNTLAKLTSKGKLPKVFRRIYYDDTTTLFRKKNKKLKTPRFLGNFNYKDVTDIYIDTKNVNITFKDTSYKYVYLSVFNDGRWQPVHWAEIKEDSTATFTKMGLNIIYLPSIYDTSGCVLPSGEPFVLTKKEKKLLDGNGPEINSVLSNINRHKTLKSKRNYKLYNRENDGWHLISELNSGKGGVIRIKLNMNTLYILSSEKIPCQFCDERIFIIDNYGNQVFY